MSDITFDDFEILAEIKKSIKEMGFEEPSPHIRNKPCTNIRNS